jgi:hypothetical protein
VQVGSCGLSRKEQNLATGIQLLREDSHLDSISAG